MGNHGTVVMLVALTVGACRTSSPTPLDRGWPPPDEPEVGGSGPDVTVPDDDDDDGETVPSLRVMSWNIEGLGDPGTDEYEATRRVIRRLDADVIGLNEVGSGDMDLLQEFAEGLGYDYVLVPDSNPFGSIRNAMLSRLPPTDATVWTPSTLARDSSANDVTRYPVSMTVVAPSGSLVTVVAQHWKSGTGDTEEFRRVVDSIRTAQVADEVQGEVVFVGDVNAEVEDVENPAAFDSFPDDVPTDYWLGSDLYGMMNAGGIPNDVFAPYYAMNMQILPLTQGDGRMATRDVSGRRIDFIFVSDNVAGRGWAGDVYDARDDANGELIYAGSPPERTDTELASDHFAVVADIRP